MAVLWGVPMTVMMLLWSRDAFGTVGTLIIGAGAAALFGILWTLWMGRDLTALVRRLYEADPSVVPAPPPMSSSRLLCNLMLGGTFAVGGHLYLGVAEWQFVPHLKNLKRHQAAQSVAAADITAVEVRPLAQRGLGQLLATEEVLVIDVKLRSGAVWSLIAPQAQRVADALRQHRALAP